MTGIQCCLNGSRGLDEHPAVPLTPEACAREAVAAVAAGATDLHVHPRTSDGRDSVAAEHVKAWVAAVRDAVDVPVGVTTGAWAWSGPTGATAAVAEWDVLPDHASVNWHEAASEAVCAALQARGVAINVGLWSERDAEEWLDSAWVEATDLILVELPDVGDQAEVAERLVELVRPTGLPILLHGEGRSAWEMVDLAGRAGVATRIGLEDVLEGPDGLEVTGNAELVALALERLGGR